MSDLELLRRKDSKERIVKVGAALHNHTLTDKFVLGSYQQALIQNLKDAFSNCDELLTDSDRFQEICLGETTYYCELIAQGGEGRVYRAIEAISKEILCLKVVEQEGEDPCREVEIMKQLKNRSTVNLRGYFVLDTDLMKETASEELNSSFEIVFEGESENTHTSHYCYILMDFCEGMSLENYLPQNNPEISISEQEAFNIFNEILTGVVYMHSKNIAHLDLKPSNVMVHNNKFKLGDFGFSQCST